MIEISGLRKRYGALQVLDGLDLVIAPGRVTAVVGPNAAGKTTLIKSILGLTRPDSGTISIDGREIDDGGQYRARIGYMPQIARYPDNLTAADLFAMMSDLRGDAVPQDEELVDSLGLRSQLEKPLRVLSGGTRQKVNAALAFLFSPSVLFLDEPTAGLDPISSRVVKDKIAEGARAESNVRVDVARDERARGVGRRHRVPGRRTHPLCGVDPRSQENDASVEPRARDRPRSRDGRGRMTTIVRKIARYGVRDLVRSRWLLGYAGFFAIATWSLLRFSDTETKALLSLVNVVLLVVPLANLVFGAMYLYGAL
jgi:Cu-processing system ATP-binding protein